MPRNEHVTEPASSLDIVAVADSYSAPVTIPTLFTSANGQCEEV